MSQSLQEFIAGDRVEGTRNEFWRRRGRIAESHASLPKTKILVRWDHATVDEIVPRASVKRVIGDTENDEDSDEVDSDGSREASDSDSETQEETDSNDSEESSDDVSEETNGDTDGQPSAPEVPELGSSTTRGPNTSLLVAEEIRSRRISGKGLGRGVGRFGGGRGGSQTVGSPPATAPTPGPTHSSTKYCHPPPPSLLHALVKKGSKTRDPIYREWQEVDGVAVDLATGHRTYDRSTYLCWNNDRFTGVCPAELNQPTIKTPLQYFLLFFPMQHMDHIVDCTNAQLVKNKKGSTTNRSEVLKYLGLRLTMALVPRPGDGIESFWCTLAGSNTVLENCGGFEGKYGMTKKRFEVLTESLRLEHFTGAENESPYQPIQSFLDAFNERTKQVIKPGRMIIVDECMSMWKGIESTYHHDSFIKVTYIPRKPVNLGVEFKCSADGESAIMLHLEIQKGANAPKQEYETSPEELPYHTAVTLRAVRNWLGTGRTVVADAAFGSVKTCVELLKRGMYFIGIIKGCTKEFPIAFSKDCESRNMPKNTFKVLVSTVRDMELADRTLMAVIYSLRPGLVRNILSSCSSSVVGAEKTVYKTRRTLNSEEGVWYNAREKEVIRRPVVIDDGMKHFGAVDYNDRFRQGYLNLETSWPTKRLWMRMFTTIFGIVCTNAYFGYRLETSRLDLQCGSDSEDRDRFFSFLGKLAHELIFNDLDSARDIKTTLRSRNSTSSTETKINFAMLLPLRELLIIKSKYDLSTDKGLRSLATYQRRCQLCKVENAQGKSAGNKTSLYCSACFTGEEHSLKCFCSPNTSRSCWEDHLKEFHAAETEVKL